MIKRLNWVEIDYWKMLHFLNVDNKLIVTCLYHFFNLSNLFIMNIFKHGEKFEENYSEYLYTLHLDPTIFIILP